MPARKTAAAAAAAGAWPRYKVVIWTGAFAAVTFVGSIYGAGLKTKMEYKQVTSSTFSSSTANYDTGQRN